jgi:hypothetical protein
MLLPLLSTLFSLLFIDADFYHQHPFLTIEVGLNLFLDRLFGGQHFQITLFWKILFQSSIVLIARFEPQTFWCR